MITTRPRTTERISRMESGERRAKMPMAAVRTPMTSSKVKARSWLKTKLRTLKPL